MMIDQDVEVPEHLDRNSHIVADRGSADCVAYPTSLQFFAVKTIP